jgi:ammonia channel protein AmtB
MFYILNKAIGLRASDEEQTMGLDLAEHGLAAYEPEYVPSADMVPSPAGD